MAELITCERCGKTTGDPDRWDPEVDTGRIFCDSCWDHRDEPQGHQDRAIATLEEVGSLVERADGDLRRAARLLSEHENEQWSSDLMDETVNAVTAIDDLDRLVQERLERMDAVRG